MILSILVRVLWQKTVRSILKAYNIGYNHITKLLFFLMIVSILVRVLWQTMVRINLQAYNLAEL